MQYLNLSGQYSTYIIEHYYMATNSTPALIGCWMGIIFL